MKHQPNGLEGSPVFKKFNVQQLDLRGECGYVFEFNSLFLDISKGLGPSKSKIKSQMIKSQKTTTRRDGNLPNILNHQ